MPEWDPSVADVAALIRARTKPRDGQSYTGTFNDATNPTEAQVQELVDQAVGEVEARTGTVPDAQEPRAGNVAAIYAAMLVELSYFPEQINTDQSPYDRLKELYDEAITGLIESIRGNGPRKGLYSVELTTPALSSDTLAFGDIPVP